MTQLQAFQPRLWAIAALAGAYAVILPCAIGFAGFRAWTIHEMARRSPDLFTAGQAGPYTSPGVAAATAFGGALLACSLVSVPVAMIFTGIMALLERKFAAARLLLFWVGAVILLMAPLAGLSYFLVGVWWGSLPFFAFGLIGSGVAWAVRHRLKRAPL